MKRFFIIGLAFVMLLGSLTACKQEIKPTESKPQTQTDLSTPAVIDQQPKEEAEAVTDASQPIQEEVNEPTEQAEEPEETKPVSKPISKVESKLESKEAKKQTASQSANFKNDSSQTATIDSDKDKETQHEFQADATSQLPIFSSVSQMEAFLKNRKAQNDVEAEILNAFGNQKVYHRPVQVDAWQLQKINLTLSGCTHYFYDFDDVVNTGSFGCDLLISVYESDPLGNNQSHFNFLKNKSGSQSFTIEEREYVYCENNSGSYSISWFQDKMYHTANLNSHTDQIETILPLLKIERVSLNTTDLVTQ